MIHTMTPQIVAASLIIALQAVPAPVQKAALATVRVMNPADSKIASGVTVGIRDGFAYVLTAGHAVGQERELKVEFFHEDERGKVEKISGRDLPSTNISVAARLVTADFAILKILLPPKTETASGPLIPPV